MNRSVKDYVIIALKGVAMGAADVVPGVSGGTIAFISGIYEELLASINSINFKTLKILKEEGFSAMWKSINGSFLLSLLLGIGISVLSLSRVIKWLLETKPILLWAFFFGLVLASIIFVGKQIQKWKITTIAILIFGAGLAYYITIIPPLSAGSNSSLFLVLAGALAICAMILPGISGAFILLLLGAYKPALDAIHNFDLKKIALLGLGAILGLFSFARVLKWMFEKHKDLTLAILTGFIIGSLNKIWPWKRVLDSEIINGKLKILQEVSVSPFSHSENPQLLPAIVLAVVGFMLIIGLEKSAKIKS